METLYHYRHSNVSDGCFGDIFRGTQNYCVTVENKDTLFPAGIYYARIFQSPHNGKCFLLSDEPNGTTIGTRSMIEIHRANWGSELKGCIAPGKAFGHLDNKTCVLNSGETLERMFTDFPDGFMLQVEEGEK